MAGLEDELDAKYHRGTKPDVYWRVPTLEALDGALQNELQKNAALLIPVELAAEFVFNSGATITIPPMQQPNIVSLGITPGDTPQTLTVDQALCSRVEDHRERLKLQRTIARSVLDVIQSIDGFKYTERQATYKDGFDGSRFKYVCLDSLQNRDRKSNSKKAEDVERKALPTFDCGGAVHIKFSKQRDAINIVYKHKPIHRDIVSRTSDIANGNGYGDPAYSEPPMQQYYENVPTEPQSPDGTVKKKRKRRTKAEMEAARAAEKAAQGEAPEGYASAAGYTMATPDTGRLSSKKKQKTNQNCLTGSPTSTKKQKNGRKSTNNSMLESVPDPTFPQPKRPCVRCKEHKIKCNEAKPTCNQCQRGLWNCEYKAPKKRSRNGCGTCKSKKRKCTEEKPICAYCARHHEDCEYPFGG